MTIKQIAELSGVSASTVSRIINSPDDSFASKEVRDRVWKVIREHDYVPNQNAKSLRTTSAARRSHNSVVCILGRTKTLSENPFLEQITRAVEQRSLSLEMTVSNILTMEQIPSAAAKQKKSGSAIVIGRIQETQIKAIERQYRNIVFVGRNPLDAPFDQVICSDREATEKAMALLKKYRHKAIAYFGETKNEVRFSAYSEAMKKASASHDDVSAFHVPHTAEGGYEAAGQLLKQKKPLPTAVFCASDSVAIAAMRRFREARIKIPEDISIIGMDNIKLSAYVSPMLTTVEAPVTEMGKVAVSILLDRINQGHKLPLKIILPSHLIERESIWPQGFVDEGSYI
jgi:DNA-binding LacI/PurR family transcriptional regulator